MNLIAPISRRYKRQRGATVVLFTMLATFVILPLVGLAIDGSIIFWAKAKLSAAVDAAALAGGRYVNVKNTTSQNTGTVVTVADQWFAANFPTGWMGATVSGPNVNYITTSSSTQQVTVSASATIPLYFLRVIGQSTATVSASAQSSRRNTFVVLVLDRSSSMSSAAYIGSDACPTMQADAVNFVNMFTEGFDTMGLVTYSSTAGPNPDFTPSQTFKTGMANSINSITCIGDTGTALGLNVAYKAIQKYGLAGGLNVIVLFTDGQPNDLAAAYPVKTSADTRYGAYFPGMGSDPDNVQRAWPASPCNSGTTTITGGLAIYLQGPTYFVPAAQGMTIGLYDTGTQVLPSQAANFVSTSSTSTCGFVASGPQYVRGDVAYIPTSDINGNLTNAGYGTNSPYYGPLAAGYSPLPDTFTTAPYSGKMRPDEQTIGIMAAAINATDYQAQAILADTTYNPVIYTIGLGGALDMPVDDTLLERIANDTRSPIYNSSVKTGMYVKAPTAGQLNQAFQLIAGQILRLSQ